MESMYYRTEAAILFTEHWSCYCQLLVTYPKVISSLTAFYNLSYTNVISKIAYDTQPEWRTVRDPTADPTHFSALYYTILVDYKCLVDCVGV